MSMCVYFRHIFTCICTNCLVCLVWLVHFSVIYLITNYGAHLWGRCVLPLSEVLIASSSSSSGEDSWKLSHPLWYATGIVSVKVSPTHKSTLKAVPIRIKVWRTSFVYSFCIFHSIYFMSPIWSKLLLKIIFLNSNVFYDSSTHTTQSFYAF